MRTLRCGVLHFWRCQRLTRTIPISSRSSGEACATKKNRFDCPPPGSWPARGRRRPALAKAADDADLSKRLLALQTLASLGEEIDEKGVLALCKALADPESRIRQTAALSLANLGVKAQRTGR